MNRNEIAGTTTSVVIETELGGVLRELCAQGGDRVEAGAVVAVIEVE